LTRLVSQVKMIVVDIIFTSKVMRVMQTWSGIIMAADALNWQENGEVVHICASKSGRRRIILS